MESSMSTFNLEKDGFKHVDLECCLLNTSKVIQINCELYKNYMKDLEDALKELCPDVTLRVNTGGKGRAYAFEITFAGILIYSKIKSKVWPHMRTVSKRIG